MLISVPLGDGQQAAFVVNLGDSGMSMFFTKVIMDIQSMGDPEDDLPEVGGTVH